MAKQKDKEVEELEEMVIQPKSAVVECGRVEIKIGTDDDGMKIDGNRVGPVRKMSLFHDWSGDNLSLLDVTLIVDPRIPRVLKES